MSEIVLIRHAQSTANIGEIWQGRGDAPLSDLGQAQAQALGSRFSGVDIDVVASSPLQRAAETAAAIRSPDLVDDDLVELDLGEWEGVGFREVAERDQAILDDFGRGSDIAFGTTGERLSDVAARAMGVIDRIRDKIGPDGRAVVVTHGGVVDALLAIHLPASTRRPHRFVGNTALTHLVHRDERGYRLARFNDATHLGTLPHSAKVALAAGDPVVALIRHGETRANAERRWQGQSDWGLNERGVGQARAFADWYGQIEKTYSSPLGRAMATAAIVAGNEVDVVDGLMEIGMGRWEGLSMVEVSEQDPDLHRRIFTDGEDLPRGGHGETWQGVVSRVVDTLESLDLKSGEVTGAVVHGGVVRALVGTLGGDRSGAITGLYAPANTSVTHVAMTANGPLLCDYAVAPHLGKVWVT